MIEPAGGVNRAMLAFLCDAYDEEVVGERERTVLRLHPEIAPVKVAVLPLAPRDAGMAERARALHAELRRVMVAEHDDGGQIGRRYRRQDEIGTPWALTRRGGASPLRRQARPRGDTSPRGQVGARPTSETPVIVWSSPVP